MRDFYNLLAELLRRSPPRQISVLDTETLAERSFTVPFLAVRKALWGAGLALFLATVLIMAFTPVRNLIPGYGTTQLRQDAIMATLRLEALEDSIQMQLQHMAHLRQILTGEIDSTFAIDSSADALGLITDPRPDESIQQISDNWEEHEQPAIFVERLPVRPVATDVSKSYLPPSMLLPAISPVNGYLTRSFDARAGHFGIDIATEEGNLVRSIGEGHVIFADWSHSGGHTLIVQHADGYVSVFKHNQRLLKRVADRVQQSEAVAVTGNTGQHSTGPHLHFELWNHGLAQDPRNYLVGL